MKVKTIKGDAYLKVNGIDWEGKSRSKLQKSCKDILKEFWNGDIVSEEQSIPKTRLKIDFVNFSKKIILEIQGGQHFKFNKHFHNNNIFNFVDSLARDDKKEEFANLNGFIYLAVKTPSELREILITMI